MSKLSYHATVRMQQRGIDPATIDYLLAFGDEKIANDGATIIYFDKSTKKKLFEQIEKTERVKLEHSANAYLVMGYDGKIVTVGHRTRRLMKH